MGTIIGMLVCLIFSAFFSASETAFTSFNRNKMKNKIADGNKRAVKTMRLAEDYDKLLSTILVGNNIVNIALSSMATIYFIKLMNGSEPAPAVSTVVVTVVVLIFGEITPKSIAKDHPEGFALAVTPLLSFISLLLTPINFLFMLWKKLVNLIFKTKSDDTVTEGEVLTLVDEAHEDGTIDEYNKVIIENIFDFDDISAGEIATHRTDLIMLSTEDSQEEWDDLIFNSKYSRYPIYSESVDDIVGILDARKYFRLHDKSRESVLENCVSPAYFVPETVKADVLFKNMKESKEYFAIVIDEYGGVQGVVTLTDLVERLVGEFTESDEEEDAELLIEKLSDNEWQISGAASISDVVDALGTTLPDCESDTFGGYVLGIYGSIPDDGSTFSLETELLDIDICGIKDHKLEKAIVRLKAVDTDDETKSKDD